MPTMLRRAVLVLVVAGLVALGPAAVVVPLLPAPVAADGDEDQDGSGQDEGQGDDGKDDKDDKEKKDKDKEKDEEKAKDDDGVAPAAGYRVEVACAYDDAPDRTTCTFTGRAPDDGKDVSHVDLPAEAICAEVVGGDAEYVDPDPNTRVVGYKSRGSEGRFSLVIEGEVATGSTATYWFKTGDGVFPASGPGLLCGGAAQNADDTKRGDERGYELETPAPGGTTAPATTPGPVLTPSVSDTDGAILVQAYACDVATAEEGYDWYGACEPAAAGARFRLEVRGEAGLAPQATAGADAAGHVRFGALEPGAYRLTQVDADWCHAQSDSVDGRGDVVVEAGRQASVWVFACTGAP